jgi:hypothetical protein
MGRIHSYKKYTILSSGAYTSVTVTNVVTTLGTIPKQGQTTANACTITVVGNASSTAGQPVAYYRANGSNPAVGDGLALFNGAVLELFESELKNARFIRADGNNQKLYVEFAIVE